MALNVYGGSYEPPVLVHNGISDVIDGASSAIDTISQALSDLGKTCVSLINGGLSVFDKLVTSAVKVLSADPSGDEFSDFWSVADKVTAVFSVLSATLITLLFLINLCTDAWDSRHEMDIWGFVKLIVKYFVSVLLVSNAVTIVTGIFKAGAALAGIVAIGDGDFSNLQMDDTVANYIRFGVAGVSGLLQTIVVLVCVGVMVASGVMICIEIYQRVFKMFILIPFSTISFSFFTMGDGNRGDEVFRGYLKSILSTAFEAIIIVVCLSFTFSLINNRGTMENLFPALDDTSVMHVDGCTYIDVAATGVALSNTYYTADSSDSSTSSPSVIGGVVDSVLQMTVKDEIKQLMNNQLQANSEDKYVVGVINNTYDFTDRSTGLMGFVVSYNPDQDLFSAAFTASGIDDSDIPDDYTVSIDVYPEMTWKNLLLCLLQMMLPIVLCTACVKKAGEFSGMIMGR